LLNVEVDSLFVTAVLTVVGFSVHDTIVIYDRIRENMRNAGKRDTFDDVANRSIKQTIARSINTSLTVCLTLLALLLFGGETIRWFVFAMLLGILIGTYSSIFNASQLLSAWRMVGVKRTPA
jgi:preprotein translocase SecF subunit